MFFPQLVSPYIIILFHFYISLEETPFRGSSLYFIIKKADTMYQLTENSNFNSLESLTVLISSIRFPIISINPTTSAFPMQKYLLRSVIPSVHLSGNPFNLSHSIGVRNLFRPLTST